MKFRLLLQFITLMSMLLIVGCGGGSKDTPVPAPGTATLSSPANNTACLKSSSATGTTASVTFSWSAASNADSYRLDIKNLNTQVTVSYNTSSVSYSLNLDVNTPYSWDVVAINNTGKTTSDVWKFYLSGAASSSYAPFPADLTSPASGATISANGASTVQVTFQWSGSDADNDIASYAFYLDNANASTQVVASQTASTLTQSLSSGKVYYWKVVTTDKSGNSSSSKIGSFQIQ
jgi:hypothetical protein